MGGDVFAGGFIFIFAAGVFAEGFVFGRALLLFPSGFIDLGLIARLVHKKQFVYKRVNGLIISSSHGVVFRSERGFRVVIVDNEDVLENGSVLEDSEDCDLKFLVHG